MVVSVPALVPVPVGVPNCPPPLVGMVSVLGKSPRWRQKWRGKRSRRGRERSRGSVCLSHWQRGEAVEERRERRPGGGKSLSNEFERVPGRREQARPRPSLRRS